MVSRLAVSFALLGSLVASFFLLPQKTFAQTSVEGGYQSIMQNGLIFANICVSPDTACECRDAGKCSLDNVLQIFVNISTGILGIIGSLVLLMFVYGGITWITSEGSPDKVGVGKRTMTNAVIGLALVLGAYALMTFVIAAVTGVEPGQSLEETIEEVEGNAEPR